MTRIKRIFTDVLFILFLVGFSACDENFTSPIPSFPVRVQVDLLGLDYDLAAAPATKSIPYNHPRVETERGYLGFGGILIINNGSSIPPTLYAFDLACPNEVPVNRDVQVVPNGNGKAICPKCGAVYTILFGTGICESGGKYPLLQYRVAPNGNNKYVVVN